MTNTLSNKAVDTQKLADELERLLAAFRTSSETSAAFALRSHMVSHADEIIAALRAWNTRTTQCSGDTQVELLREAREDLAMCAAEMSTARGRLEMLAGCNEDRRVAAALGSTCDHLRSRWFAPDTRIDSHLGEMK